MNDMTITFKNWDFDEIILELANHIERGFNVVNVSYTSQYLETEIEVNLIKSHKK